ncbi:MAG TPA: MarP family serine protease [Solirubrobacterales bacterium]|nr:MarP family serine protease [Solirubrobacterales bacterium]
MYSGVTFLDWAIVAFTLALALWGYRQGLIVGALTLAGFAVGAFTGSRVGPMLLAQGPDSAYAPLCGALGALLIGALAAVAFESFALGLRQRLIRRRRGLLHRADGAGGAALIASVALGLAWVFGAVALHAPATAELRADVQGSLILRSLNRMMPPSGPVLGALNRVDPAPTIGGPPPPATPPDPAVVSDPDVDAAGDSVVRVLGTACGLGVEGSGWAVRPDLVVTNAHVIAGSDDTTVTNREGIEQEATPVYFGPNDDLALLRVETELEPLSLVLETRPGASGAVLGYPENGPYALSPARLGETRSVISEDAYGNGPLERSIAALRGEVRSGNSGGPMVDGAGRVLGTVFAATTSGPKGGFAIPNEAVYRALDGAGGEVGTGPCSR